MNTIIARLKEHLRNNKDKFVDHSEWNGNTETGFYVTDDFDIDKLMEEIDKFAAEFQSKRVDHDK